MKKISLKQKKVTMLTVGLLAIVGIVGATQTFTPPTTIISHALYADISKSELVHESDLIAIGTVIDQNVVKRKSDYREGENDIVTISTVSIDTVLYNPKNLSYTTVRLETLGGALRNTTMVMDGAAQLAPEERVLVFLEQAENDSFSVYGDFRGKYGLSEDGLIGTTQEEKDTFNTVFGRLMNLDELKLDIATILATKYEPRTDIATEPLDVGPYMTPEEKNALANTVLKN